jgi:hypothetical protein
VTLNKVYRLVFFFNYHGFKHFLSRIIGRAIPQRLDPGFPPRRPGFAYGQHVGFVVDNAALGQVFSEYFGFPCQSFHRFPHYHNHPGLTQQAIRWPQCRVDLDSTPHYENLKKKKFSRIIRMRVRLMERPISTQENIKERTTDITRISIFLRDSNLRSPCSIG